jgi:2-Cys peroxiredoxin 5
MFASRRLAPRLSRAGQQITAGFHSSRPNFVKAGTAIPSVELMEDSPGNKVNLASELKGKGLIIGTPGAFSTLVGIFRVGGIWQLYH